MDKAIFICENLTENLPWFKLNEKYLYCAFNCSDNSLWYSIYHLNSNFIMSIPYLKFKEYFISLSEYRETKIREFLNG